MPTLVDDVLHHVLGEFSEDYRDLYRCSLVSWRFNSIASKLLYARVEYSPPFRPVLDLKDRGEIPESSMFRSACRPRYSPLVAELKISGWLSTRPSPISVLPSTIANALRLFTNLSRVTFTPSTYHESIFVESLKILSEQCPHLSDVTVNPSCTQNITAPLLIQINHLCRLTLSSPGRTILELLPEWLSRLSNTLVGLHLTDNCGSITPGVLMSFLPHVHHRLQEFTFGLSYSLTDRDVFMFLEQLSCLERLQLQYYLQLKTPITLNLSTLTYFVASYPSSLDKRGVIRFCRWVKAVISTSQIEHLRLVLDKPDPVIEVNIPFDTIVGHLVNKHALTLRYLDLRSAYVSVEGVKTLFSGCLQLEVFYIAARESALDIFQEYSSGMKRLHTASFTICNRKRRGDVVDQTRATWIIYRTAPSFCRLIINESKWERLWISGIRDDGEGLWSLMHVSHIH